jgi:hypothetical protein
MEYLELLPGDKVVIKGKHPIANGHWCEYPMDETVGKTTTIEKYVGHASVRASPSYYTTIFVDKGCGQYYYRMGDFTILPNMRNINHPYFWAKKLGKLPAGMY